MRDDLFCDRVAALGIPIGHAISEAMPREALDGRDQMPPLLVEEGDPIGDQVLQISDLRTIDRWVKDFSENALPEREPYATRCRDRCTDAVLCENSADVGSPDHWRIDAAGRGRMHPEIRPNRHRP